MSPPSGNFDNFIFKMVQSGVFWRSYYVSPRRGIRFVLHAVSDRSLSLSVISNLLFGITRPLLERELPNLKCPDRNI